MAEREIHVASVGPLLYDDADMYDDAVTFRGFRARNIYLDVDPAVAEEAARKGYVDDLIATHDEFTDMTDTPANYTAANYELVRVNNVPDALEFATLAGTANQVVVTHAAGSVTLSLPQDIDTGATPTLGDLTLSTPVNIYALSHDSFADFVANKHIDHSGVFISSGGILSGGGDITVNRTISLAHGDVDHDQTANFVANKHIDTTAWTAHLIPADTTAYDLGSGSKYWAELYVQHVYASGNATFDGGDIGITSDPDLIGLVANALTVNGTLAVTGSFVYGATANVFLQLGSSYIALRTEVNDAIYFDAGGVFTWRDVDGGYATRMTLNSATGLLTVTGNGIFDGGDIGITSDPDLLGLALNILTVRGAIHCDSNLWIEAAASSYVGIRSTAGAAQYYDAGGVFTWRDYDAAYAIRMTLDSSNGLLSPTTVQPTSGYNSVNGSAGITNAISILDGDGINTHLLTFKNGILTAYSLGV